MGNLNRKIMKLTLALFIGAISAVRITEHNTVEVLKAAP